VDTPAALRTALFDRDFHMATLSLFAARALMGADAKSAFMLADRLCRSRPHPEVADLILRAEARFRLGKKEDAISELLRCVQMAPDDEQANRRLLQWGSDTQRRAAAEAMVSTSLDPSCLALSIDALRIGERKLPAFGRVVVGERNVSGWAVWRGVETIGLVIDYEGSRRESVISSSQDHPLARCLGRAANFDFAVQKVENLRICLTWQEQSFLVMRHSFRASTPVRPSSPAGDSVASIDDRPVAVIVPVYGHFQATRNSLEWLQDGQKYEQYDVIIVADDPPEKELVEYLKSLHESPRLRVLWNDENLGFTRSVNKALTLCHHEDVVLLNADTLLPAGAIGRLSAAAYQSERIGTVTPLSNNGQFTSFPKAFVENAIPEASVVRDLDRRAAAANKGLVVDIPSGIGFCLYITRACLDAVGFLDPQFGHGYLEEVDFCLRGRHLGFRNICAANVYVGHVGALSFGSRKRRLVLKNTRKINSRFPDYQTESAIFVKADPLRIARAALELASATPHIVSHLLVASRGPGWADVQRRSQQWFLKGAASLILELPSALSPGLLALTNPNGEMPQSLSFDPADSSAMDKLRSYLTKLEIARIEIFNPSALTQTVFDLLKSLGAKIDVYVANAELVCPRASSLATECCGSFHDVGRSCAARIGKNGKLYDELISRVESAIPADHMGYHFVRRFLPHIANRLRTPEPEPLARPARRAGRGGTVGIFPVSANALTFRAIKSLALELARRNPESLLVVFGETLDDLELMSIGNVFVSGAVVPDDYESLVQYYDCDRIFLVERGALFGHPAARFARRSGLPTAFFDWSFGALSTRGSNLRLDPFLAEERVNSEICSWCGPVLQAGTR